ncbi:MAG: class I SAM-dependent RNA methyltransferase [Chloroflexi bacterium]|nr:class I SAM-dependent RNA methyltransferase [Chloroflexota bacterium]
MSQTRIEVEVERMAHGGEGVGRDASGRAVFVDGGLPGERVLVGLDETRERHARGRLVAMPDPVAPERRPGAAPCPHFGAWPERGLAPERHCGGCSWQHVDYSAQLRFKQQALIDSLNRIGGIAEPIVHSTIGMPDPWHYRNHLRLKAGPAGVGLVAMDGARVLGVQTCHIAHPLVNDLLDQLELELPEGSEVSLRAGTATGDQMIVLRADAAALESIDVESEASVLLIEPDGRIQLASGRPWLVERLEDRDFLVPPGSFFQVNTVMAEQLVACVRRCLPDDGRVLADIYSGVGTFTALLADRFEAVLAIESDREAVAAAVDNAAGLDQVTLFEADAAEGLAHLGDAPDVLLVDPPRGGLSRSLTRLLAQHPAHTIVYVSCEPATLARDARQLVAAGWRFVDCQPVDMFPQTYHVESVSTFSRRAP